MPPLNAYRSSALRRMTRKVKRNRTNSFNNTYVPSNTVAPALNLSYVGNRNASVRNSFNRMVVGRAPMGNTTRANLGNRQQAARINAARKMALGETLTNYQKFMAGIKALPKPKGPKPVKGGAMMKTIQELIDELERDPSQSTLENVLSELKSSEEEHLDLFAIRTEELLRLPLRRDEYMDERVKQLSRSVIRVLKQELENANRGGGRRKTRRHRKN